MDAMIQAAPVEQESGLNEISKDLIIHRPFVVIPSFFTSCRSYTCTNK